MKLFLFTIILICIAIGIGYEIHSDTGYVLIHYHGWQLESSLWVALCIFAVTFLALYLFFRLLGYILSISKHLQRAGLTRRYKKRRQLTQSSCCALLEGQWKKAEKLAADACSFKHNTLIHHLTAAYAAHEQGAFHRRDEYLRSAKATKQSRLALGLCMALLQIKSKQYEQAIATLQNLARRHPKHHRVLSLLKTAYYDIGDWSQLTALQPRLLKLNLITEEEGKDYTLKNHLFQIKCLAKTDPSQLPLYWKSINRSCQQNVDLLHMYLRALTASQQYIEVVQCITCQQKHIWTPDILCYLQHCPNDLLVDLLKPATQWLKKHPLDQELLLLLAHCYIADQEWNKAEHHLEQILSLNPSPDVFITLALVAEKTGKLQQALHFHRQSTDLKNQLDNQEANKQIGL